MYPNNLWLRPVYSYSRLDGPYKGYISSRSLSFFSLISLRYLLLLLVWSSLTFVERNLVCFVCCVFVRSVDREKKNRVCHQVSDVQREFWKWKAIADRLLTHSFLLNPTPTWPAHIHGFRRFALVVSLRNEWQAFLSFAFYMPNAPASQINL